MPQTTINKLITGITADPRISTLLPIAEHFKIPLESLVKDAPTFSNTKQDGAEEQWIPIIAFDELSERYNKLHTLTAENWPNWFPIPKQDYHNYYAIQLQPQQLLTPFDQSSILIIKNHSTLTPNCFCMVKHIESNSLSVKKVLIDGGKEWLLALKTDLPSIEFDAEEWQVLGIIQAIIIDVSQGEFLAEK